MRDPLLQPPHVHTQPHKDPIRCPFAARSGTGSTSSVRAMNALLLTTIFRVESSARWRRSRSRSSRWPQSRSRTRTGRQAKSVEPGPFQGWCDGSWDECCASFSPSSACVAGRCRAYAVRFIPGRLGLRATSFGAAARREPACRGRWGCRT